MQEYNENRNFLKGYTMDFITESEAMPEEEQKSDQQKGLPPPPVQKPCLDDAKIIDLIGPEQIKIGNESLISVIKRRRSRRRFTSESLTLEELSFLLYATQGVEKIINDKRHGNPRATLRTSPSGGARHPFETYLFINRVEGIECGIYRYLPLEHKLCFIYQDEELPKRLNEGCCDQEFVGDSAVVFIWTAQPYRTEWRYHRYRFCAKIIAQDSGHLCQNLYLASESIGCGTCAIGAYLQEKMDEIVRVDGMDEFTIYVAPVGRIRIVAPIHLKPSDLQAFIGAYAREDRPERIVNIGVENEQLLLTAPDQAPLQMSPISKNKFLLEIADDEITFKTDESGRIIGLSVDQSGSVRYLKKMD